MLHISDPGSALITFYGLIREKFSPQDFQLFCLNDKEDRMCKVLTLFTLGSLWQVSLSSSAVINFVCCNAKLNWVYVQVRVSVYISEEKSGLDTECS